MQTVGANNTGLRTYIRADEESKEVGEYVDVYEDGGTMMIKDPENGAGANEQAEQTGSIQIERDAAKE